MIRVELPFHLRTLARIAGEVHLDVVAPATLRSVIDAIEARYPMLRGTIRDHVTRERRPFIRFYACERDLSHDPTDARFDRRRYWRGPCWLIVNYILADGLRRSGRDDVADEIIADSLALIRRSGFAEYYDPLDGAALGGGSFTWTAAMVIEFLDGRATQE